MSDRDPTPSHPRHIWLQRFGVRLMQLRPDMSAVLAARQAVDAFRDAAELEPEAAAERFNAEDASGEEGRSE
jgi:hypothetical protein